jgi:murein DD-endopeptidase MepM/ murein hydrolase activator NlpD
MTGLEASARSRLRAAVMACIALVCATGALYAGQLSRSPGAATNSAPGHPPTVSKPQPAAESKPLFQAIEAGRLAPSYDDVAEVRVEPALQPKIERFKLDHPISVAGLLRDAGLEEPERNAWAEAFRSSAHWGVLSPGHQVSVFKDPKTGRVQALEYDLDDESVIRAQNLGDGVVLASRQALYYQPQTVAYSLSLAEGLEVAAAKKHVPDAVVEQIKDAFGTRLPQVGSGGTVKLVYKELVTPDGSHHRDQDLQACKIQLGRRSFCAFSFHDEQGREHLYDEQGNSLQPQFLRFPVAFQYISSSFSPSRYHPILHRFRAHVGVDLAARYGTPVKAVSDGKIQFADWDGELGRCIRIEHDNSLVSVYAHLSQISPEVKQGAPVRIGQVIGYVGSTGLSTGPHLHYALIKDGQFVDPLTANLDEGGGVAISSDRRPLFEQFKRQFERALGGIHGVGQGWAANESTSRVITLGYDTELGVGETLPSKSSRHRSRHHPVHLLRGGLLRDGHKDADNSPFVHLIKSGLLGDPSL